MSLSKKDLVEEVEREIKRMEAEFEDTAAGMVVLKRAQDAIKLRVDIADNKSVHKLVDSACCTDRLERSENNSLRSTSVMIAAMLQCHTLGVIPVRSTKARENPIGRAALLRPRLNTRP